VSLREALVAKQSQKITAIALVIIAVLFTYNRAIADIKFIPKEGKLWVEASGELVILKSIDKPQQYFALKLEDKNIYILSGEAANQLRKLTGKQVEVNGLLKARIEFEKKLIPNIEVKSVKEIALMPEK